MGMTLGNWFGRKFSPLGADPFSVGNAMMGVRLETRRNETKDGKREGIKR